MKINYVPGLPLRLFPQTSRDPYVAFKNFTQHECDLVLMTGNCPDTDTLWNITNLEDFLSNKQDKIVYREKHSVQFSYDGNKQKRIIQRLPINSIEIIAQNGVIPQNYVSNIVITDGSVEWNKAYAQYQLDLAEYQSINNAYQVELYEYNLAATHYNSIIDAYQVKVDAYNNALDQYQLDINKYQTDSNQYQIDLAQYQDDLIQYQNDLNEYNNPTDPENPTITEEPIAPIAPTEPVAPVAPTIPEDTTIDLVAPTEPVRPARLNEPAPTPPPPLKKGVPTEMNPDSQIPEHKRILSDNGIYALLKVPHKETSSNTTGNDLIILISNVGTLPDDFVSISDIHFIQGKKLNLRNLTISIFQGYQITDAVINREVEDPNNPGEVLQIPINTKKAVHMNRVWGKYLAEAYRNCFASDQSFTWRYTDVLYAGSNRSHNDSQLPVTIQQTDTCNTLTNLGTNYTGATDPIYLMNYNGTSWSGNLEKDIRVMHYGILVNQAVVDVIDAINSKELNEEIPLWSTIVNSKWFASSTINNTFRDKQRITAVTIVKFLLNQTWLSDAHKTSVAQILRELNLEEQLIARAMKCIIPIAITNASWTTSLNSDDNVLTVKNETPARLYSRFRMSRNNPTNEQLYILLPRYLNRSNIDQPLGNHHLEPIVPNPPSSPSTTGDYSSQSDPFRLLGSTSGVTFARTQDIIDGENINYNSNKLRIYDYTAISMGLPGSNADMEVDVLHTIDYIDSIQAQIKLPNQF